jgi:hypothetical protein
MHPLPITDRIYAVAPGASITEFMQGKSYRACGKN